MSIKPVEPVHFQSKSPNLCTFFAIAPEGTRVEDVFLPAFWSRVATTSATKANIPTACLRRRSRAHTRVSWALPLNKRIRDRSR
jgi:hypothetical protein